MLAYDRTAGDFMHPFTFWMIVILVVLAVVVKIIDIYQRKK